MREYSSGESCFHGEKFIRISKLCEDENRKRELLEYGRRFLKGVCENNGNIGNVKNEAISLCRGKYVLEFDHDDEILPFVLKDSADYFDANPDIGFIYMDCIALYENGSNHFFGDFICKGYGSYY